MNKTTLTKACKDRGAARSPQIDEALPDVDYFGQHIVLEPAEVCDLLFAPCEDTQPLRFSAEVAHARSVSNVGAYADDPREAERVNADVTPADFYLMEFLAGLHKAVERRYGPDAGLNHPLFRPWRTDWLMDPEDMLLLNKAIIDFIGTYPEGVEVLVDYYQLPPPSMQSALGKHFVLATEVIHAFFDGEDVFCEEEERGEDDDDVAFLATEPMEDAPVDVPELDSKERRRPRRRSSEC